MNVRSLILRELEEGMTEEELASAIEVSPQTLANIIANEFPNDSTVWDKFTRYFRLDVDILQTGGSIHSTVILNLSDRTLQSATGLIRKIPLLDWHQLSQIITSKHPPDVIHANAAIDTTDIVGKHTVALKVNDDSMAPMFCEGQIIFVDPDSEWKPGDYVIVYHPGEHPEPTLFRQVEYIECRCILHPLNPRYENILLAKQDRVWGKVVRLTKSL